MIVVGVILLLVMIAAAVGAGVGGGQTTEVVLGPLRIESTTSTFFFIGVVVALGAALGVWCLLVGTKHWRARRQELKELRQRSAQPAAAGATLAAGESQQGIEGRSPVTPEPDADRPAAAAAPGEGAAQSDPRHGPDAGPAPERGGRGEPSPPEGPRPGQEPMP